MIAITTFITVLYFGLISYYLVGFINTKNVETKNYEPKYSFSICIPFRNESANLPTLLNSLKKLNYPFSLFEILFVNDDSTDDFKPIFDDFIAENPLLKITILNNKRLSNSPKKDAIKTAIEIANYNYILTTDADCIVPENWLFIFNQFILDEQPYFISAPVLFIEKKSLLFHFQNLHFLSLIGSTIGSFGVQKPLMCNGANLCYNKTIFNELNGFEGNTTLASGDDVFLMEKFDSFYPLKTRYLKSTEAVVQTNAELNLTDFKNQQLRWASKTTSYKNTFNKAVGLLVFGINFLLLILLIAATINPFYLQLAFAIFIGKFLIDFLLIKQTASFLNSKISLPYFLIVSLIYPLFISYIAIFSQFENHRWKGRNYK